jgi:hypothetical protein
MQGKPRWIKSTRCASGTCVEVAYVGDDTVLMRDSKNPDQQFHAFDRASWAAFIDGVKAGDYTWPQA